MRLFRHGVTYRTLARIIKRAKFDREYLLDVKETLGSYWQLWKLTSIAETQQFLPSTSCNRGLLASLLLYKRRHTSRTAIDIGEEINAGLSTCLTSVPQHSGA
jgi:hypothetical protein